MGPTISILPIVTPAQIDEGILEDLVINLGRAKERHRPMVAQFPPWKDPDFDINAFIRACDEMRAASETMWGYLLDRIVVPEGLPPRYRDVLCLGVMCRLFGYAAVVTPSKPIPSAGGMSWGVHVAITDNRGNQLSESFGASSTVDPSDSTASLGAYYSATAEAFRDAARSLFPFGAPYESEDNIIAVDPDTGEAR